MSDTREQTGVKDPAYNRGPGPGPGGPGRHMGMPVEKPKDFNATM